jgi:hypothetical protein
MVGLDALPTYIRVVAWFPGPAEDTERYFRRLRRLNRGLDTGEWWVYMRGVEPNGVRLLLSIDISFVTARLITPLINPRVLLWSAMGLITPLYGGLEPTWRPPRCGNSKWFFRADCGIQGCVVAASMVPCC